jgi:FtsZ-binding cell division protein ZapB
MNQTNEESKTPAEKLQTLQSNLTTKKSAYSESDLSLSKHINSCNIMYQNTLEKLKDLYCANTDYTAFVTEIQGLKIKELQELQEKNVTLTNNNNTLTINNKTLRSEHNDLQRKHNNLLTTERSTS